MKTLRPAARRRRRAGHHHMHVYQAALRCWVWDCPCGGGIHSSSRGLPTQHAALVAALDHANNSPGG